MGIHSPIRAGKVKEGKNHSTYECSTQQDHAGIVDTWGCILSIRPVMGTISKIITPFEVV